MTRRHRPSLTRPLLAALALTVAPLVACSNDTSSPPATTTTTTSPSGTLPKSFEVNTKDGQLSLSLDGKLPPGWPSTFPLPSGATPAGSGSLGGSSTTGMVGVFTTNQSSSDVYSFYTGAAGLQVEDKTSVGLGDAYVGTVQFGGTPSGRVTTLPKGGQTLIVVTLNMASTTTGSTPGSTPGTTTGTAKT